MFKVEQMGRESIKQDMNKLQKAEKARKAAETAAINDKEDRKV